MYTVLNIFSIIIIFLLLLYCQAAGWEFVRLSVLLTLSNNRYVFLNFSSGSLSFMLCHKQTKQYMLFIIKNRRRFIKLCRVLYTLYYLLAYLTFIVFTLSLEYCVCYLYKKKDTISTGHNKYVRTFNLYSPINLDHSQCSKRREQRGLSLRFVMDARRQRGCLREVHNIDV